LPIHFAFIDPIPEFALGWRTAVHPSGYQEYEGKQRSVLLVIALKTYPQFFFPNLGSPPIEIVQQTCASRTQRSNLEQQFLKSSDFGDQIRDRQIFFTSRLIFKEVEMIFGDGLELDIAYISDDFLTLFFQLLQFLETFRRGISEKVVLILKGSN